MTATDPGTATGGFGSRLGERWTAWYTRRLPAEAAEERRAEITSDLWEHATDAAASGTGSLHHNIEVIGRVLSGAPADLSWRRGILRPQRRPETGGPIMKQRFDTASEKAVIVLASLGLAPAAMVIPTMGSVPFTGDWGLLPYLFVIGVFAGMLLAGLILRVRHLRPRLSTLLLVLGSVTPTVAFFWLPPRLSAHHRHCRRGAHLDAAAPGCSGRDLIPAAPPGRGRDHNRVPARLGRRSTPPDRPGPTLGIDGGPLV